jgi:hypothetical protein
MGVGGRVSEEIVTAPSSEKPAAQERGFGARRFHELWLTLSRTPWKSLVLVPVDPDGSSAELATGLANAGSHLSEGQVTLILDEALDSPSAAKSISNRVVSMRQGGAPGHLLVALQSVTVQPLGVVIARKADVAVLCVRLGTSRLADARRTIALIGEERIAGAIVVS